MRRVVSFVMLIALLSNCTYVLPQYHNYERKTRVAVSSRVGEVLDASEAEQYSLFGEVKDFESAIFYGIEGGGYEAIITTAEGRYVAVNRDSRAIEIIGDYIDEHDSYMESREEYENKWGIIDYDVLGFGITKSEIDANTDTRASLGCAIGSGLLAIPAIIVVSVLVWLSNWELDLTPGGQQNDDTGSMWGIAPFLCVAVGIGVTTYIMHRENDRNNALEKIRQERKPRFADSTEIEDM